MKSKLPKVDCRKFWEVSSQLIIRNSFTLLVRKCYYSIISSNILKIYNTLLIWGNSLIFKKLINIWNVGWLALRPIYEKKQ